MSTLNYNERSWAIDLITEINRWTANKNLLIKRAGGESTLKTNNKTYFPDVLLFGDDTSGIVLQGWELKMPDTPINDKELIANAKDKANILGLNSFLLWNVTTAVLYKINDEGKETIVHTWNDLSSIQKREDVESKREEWIKALHKILDDLVFFFNKNEISASTIGSCISSEGISDMILAHTDLLANELKDKVKKDGELSDSVTLWWLSAKSEYIDYKEPWKPLAKLILISWINKLTFAHVLKKYNKDAYLVDNIKDDLTIEEGVDYINQIAIKCNYRNIFKLEIGENYLPKLTWDDIKRINELLIDSRFENISNDTMQIIISNIVKRSTRRIYGQFTTPKELAALIAALTIRDKTKNTLDPCCGTGTIPKACYDWKVYSGIEKHNALETIWASDKLNFPLQLAMMSLTDPGVIGDVVKVFNQDATMIEPGIIANMQDAKNGKTVEYEIPKMGYILSNLPFVQQEDIDKINSGTKSRINEKISNIIGAEERLDGRSDLYGYLPFALYNELEDNGKMTIIISNAWQASKWGDQFYNLLLQFYNIESIITSGKGRWFSNADVVTNILVLTKTEDRNNRSTKYIVLNESLNDLVNTENKIDYEKLNELTVKIRNKVEDDRITSTEYTHEEIENLLNLGISKSAFFGDVKWINKVEDKLIKASNLFDIGRGERRGWDAMFYPEEGHGIEAEYIKPVLKSSRDINGYVAEADSEAFCCDETLTNLSTNSKNGALRWIRSFENQMNKTGRLLPTVLKRTGINWYTMLPNTMAEICISINPGDRLFYARLKEPSFVNQRLIRFVRVNNDTNIKLCTALLNSVLGLFFIEALGFGRGLGALDLSATKLKENLLMLNPALISDEAKVDILNKYSTLENREVLNIKDELISEDRQEFDKAVLSAFGIEDYEIDIKNALITLFNIRKAATE